MKKTLKITGIVLGTLLLLLILLPVVFKGKIREAIIAQGNAMLDARMNFSSLNVSLIKNFPLVSARLNDFSIVGVGKFEGDTLVRAANAGVSFNLASIFGKDGYEVRKVELRNAMVNAIVLQDSTANWDIMKPVAEDETVSDTASAPFNVKLKKLDIKGFSLSYDDRTSGTLARVGNLDATLSGDFSASRTSIDLKALAEGIYLRSGGVALLNGGRFQTKMSVDADLMANKFTFKNNSFSLNAIEAVIDGWLAAPAGGDIDMDLTLNTPAINFRDILSLIPAIYSKDFESLQASGQVSLKGWAKGTMPEGKLPALNLDIKVDNGSLRYPALPAGIDAVNIAANISNPGGDADLTVIRVEPLGFTLAGNPFRVTATVTNPVSDMGVAASAHGTLDLGKIKEVYPLDSMQLNGVVKADVTLNTRMSYIEKEQYDKVQANGTIALTGMTLRSPGSPEIDIRQSTLTFSPRYLDLSRTELLIGGSDLSLDCRVENYIAYALQGGTLHGKMNLASKKLNVSELTGQQSTPEQTESAPLSVIEVPRNLDLEVNAAIEKMTYDKLAINALHGLITVRNGTADMKNLSMQTLGGSVVMTGSYSTASNAAQPDFGASFAMKGLSFAETFRSFVTIQKIVPLFENLNGDYSGSLSLSTTLDEQMTPVLNTLSGAGSLSTKDISLADVGVISTIADLANISGMKDRKVKDMKIDFTIADGKIATKPFDIRMGEATLNLQGTTSLDQTIDYRGKVQLPAAATALAKVSSVGLKIGGTFTKPQISIDTKDLATQVIQGAVNSTISEIGQKLGVDLSDAQKQKDQLIETARKGGELLMEQAYKQAEELTSKAGKDPISQAAVKKLSDKLIIQAQRNVDDMVARASAKGDSIIERAKLGVK